MVYDVEQRDDLNDLISPAEQRAMSDRAISDYAAGGTEDASGYANNARSEGDAAPGSRAARILAAERDAAKGGFGRKAAGAANAAGKAAEGATSAAAGGLAKGGLAALESAVPAAGAAAAASAAANTLTKGLTDANGKKIGRNRAFLVTAGIILFGGGGLSYLSMASGPLKIIHFGELMKQIWTDPHTGQSDSRTMKLYRTLKYLSKGEPQKTHMGMVGNAVADRIKDKLESRGIKSEYSKTTGGFKGYTIDPKRVAGLSSSVTAEDAARILKESPYKISAPITVNPDGTVFVQGDGLTGRQERQLGRAAMKLAGYGRMTGALAARIYGVRNLVGWKHKFQKKINSAIDDEARGKGIREFLKSLNKDVTQGVKPPAAPVDTAKNDEGKPRSGTEAEKSEVGKIQAEATEAFNGAADGDNSKMTAFNKSVVTKIATGVGLVGLICFLDYIANHYDEIYQKGVELPMMRLASWIQVFASQLMNGFSFDNHQDQIDYMLDRMHNKIPGQESDITDNEVFNSALDKPGGVKLPDNAKPDKDGNPITKVLTTVETYTPLKQICGALDDPIVGGAVAIGTIVIMSVLTKSSPVGPAIQTALSIGGGLVVSAAVGQIAATLAGRVIDTNAQGGLLGAYVGMGKYLEGRAMALPTGALPVAPGVSEEVRVGEMALQNEEFKQQNLAYRLFNKEDPKSFFAQVIDRQSPNPTTNIAEAGLNILNIGKTFGTLATLPFSKPVAAATKFDYEASDYIYTPQEMDDEKYSDPFKNADTVADLLDQKPEYVERAQKCFNVKIIKVAVKNPDTGEQELQWSIAPPENAADPLEKFLLDPDNKCLPITAENKAAFPDNEKIQKAKTWKEADVVEWTRVRFFIYDTTIMNAIGCYESDGSNVELTKTCVDVGLEQNKNAAGSTGVGGTSTGGLGLDNWKLTLPIGAPDEISCNEIKAGKDRAPYYINGLKINQGLTFFVKPGATTKNSKNSRSELREMADNCGKEASWSSSQGTHEMTITTNVQAVEGNLPVVVGQIHDAEDDTAVFRVEGTNLHITNGDDSKWKVISNAITIGKPFTVKFLVQSDVIKFFLDGKEVASQPHKFGGAYFKAGNYLQSNGRGDGTAKVQITALEVKHDGKVTSGNGGANTPNGGTGATSEPIPGSDAPGGAIGSSLTPNNTTAQQNTLDGLGDAP